MNNSTGANNNSRYALLAFLAIGVVAIAALAAGALTGVIGGAAPTPTPGLEAAGVMFIEPPRPLSDFTLTDQRGDAFGLDNLKGNYALVFFGFANCPDYCPTTMADFTQVKAALGDEAENVDFVFVSVDGERDTPEALARFVRRFDPSFIGLTGDEEAISMVAEQYGVEYAVRKDLAAENGFYPVDHSTRSYLVSPDGALIAEYAYGTLPNDIAESIRLAMAA
jgi:protein SCO1/2